MEASSVRARLGPQEVWRTGLRCPPARSGLPTRPASRGHLATGKPPPNSSCPHGGAYPTSNGVPRFRWPPPRDRSPAGAPAGAMEGGGSGSTARFTAPPSCRSESRPTPHSPKWRCRRGPPLPTSSQPMPAYWGKTGCTDTSFSVPTTGWYAPRTAADVSPRACPASSRRRPPTCAPLPALETGLPDHREATDPFFLMLAFLRRRCS